MRKHTQVRLQRSVEFQFRNGTIFMVNNFLSQFPKHAPLRFRTIEYAMGQDNVPEKVHTMPIVSYRDLSRMQSKMQARFQKRFNMRYQRPQVGLITGNDHKVVSVASVAFDSQLVLHELVKLIHINIGKQLRRQIPNRYAFALEQIRTTSGEAFHDLPHQPHKVLVVNPSFENTQQNVVINRIEESSHIALQDKAGARIVIAHSSQHICKCPYALMGAFANTARKRCRDKGRLENRIENAKNRVMQKAITDRRFVNLPQFRVGYAKPHIFIVSIRFASQGALQGKNALLQRHFKPEHVLFISLVLFESVPCTEKRLGGANDLEQMFVSFHGI